MMPCVEVTNLSVRYPGNAQATLSDLNLTVATGASLAVLGRSGSGKSTLVMHAIGLRRPESGRIRILGQDLGSLSANAMDRLRATQIGVVFQRAHLLHHLSVRANIELAIALSGRAEISWEPINRRITDLQLDRHLLDRRADRLSVGEAQRVALVRALASDPPLLVADEPTGALDRTNAELVTNAIVTWLQDGQRSALVATHDAVLYEQLGGRLELK